MHNVHPEKCFVEATKIWLDLQNFSFKYGSMEIFFDSTKHFSGCMLENNILVV